MVNSADLEIEYRYSSRRRSIALMVTHQGKLVVTSPRGIQPPQISLALARHRRTLEDYWAIIISWLVFLSTAGLLVLVGIFTTTKTGNDPIKKEIVATGYSRRLLHPDQDCAGGG